MGLNIQNNIILTSFLRLQCDDNFSGNAHFCILLLHLCCDSFYLYQEVEAPVIRIVHLAVFAILEYILITFGPRRLK